MIRTFPDIDALSEAAAQEIVAIAKASVEASGQFSLALAGGSTPRRMYELLATRHRDAMPWDRTVIVFGDERFVPADDPRSNYRMAREAMLDRVPIAAARVHPVPTDAPTVGDAAASYDETLRQALGRATAESTVDVALLGVGGDGHTASLFPGSPALDVRDRWAAPVDAPAHIQPGVPRVTTTLPFLDAARTVMFLVAGADKRAVIGEILGGGDAARRYPAALVAPRGRALWMIDQAAMPPDRSNA